MTSRRASIAGLIVATFALLYVPVFLFCVYNVPGVFELTGVIEGGLEKSFVIVTGVGAIVGFALAVHASDAAAPPIDRRRARRAKIVAGFALAGALFWWFVIVVGGALAIR